MAQMIKHLPSKHKALGSVPRTKKNKTQKFLPSSSPTIATAGSFAVREKSQQTQGTPHLLVLFFSFL